MNTPKKPRPPLRFFKITKDHGDVRAVGPVTFTVNAGESVALVGHNGSGKSTLLAIAAGVLDPTEGNMKVNGFDAGEPPARAAISYIRDHPILYEDLTVREHLDYLSRLHGSTPEAHKADELLARLGLDGRADDLPSTFSRGLRQKAAIVVALCRPFTTLLIDEPFSGLDDAGQQALLELLDEIGAQGGSILVATHDQSALKRFDRAVVLSEGELVFDGAAADIPRR